jgi:GTP-binding protein EngB required for normal cell division
MSDLSVAVVGHANAGKTSLMRTLLRDSEFGEVEDQAGTTRHVEGGALLIDESKRLSLFDTPGLEDSIALLDILNNDLPDTNCDGIERLHAFLNDLNNYPELQQEAKVLRALLNNDLIFYVIDLREPILGKYLDELKILSFAAKPVIPVLNFTQQGAENIAPWKKQLARLNFHAFVAFDNVHFKFSDELKIYQKMQTLLADKELLLTELIKLRESQWQETFDSAKQLVANLFIEAACVRYEAENNETAITAQTERLQQSVRQAESSCVQQLLQLYQFRQSDLQNEALPVQYGQWELDLFSSDNLQEFGISLGSNIAKGAGIGVAIDVAVGGITLGTAALSGGVVGALWSVKQRYYDEIEAKIKGKRYLCVDDVTLQVLWLRQLKLLATLQQRGHASFDKIALQNSIKISADNLPKRWNSYLRKLHAYPQWSSLNRSIKIDDSSKRDRCLKELISEI